MTPSIAIIGAGAGLGAAAARRFGAEGFSVGLISRNQERLDALAAELERTASRPTLHRRRPRPGLVRRRPDRVTATLGPIEVLLYSPLPTKEYMRPVLETTAADLAGPVEFSLYGSVTAANHVLQGMRFLGQGRGTILFVNGGSAVTPRPHLTGTPSPSPRKPQLLHEQLGEEGIQVSQLIIPGAIIAADPIKDPEILAGHLWGLHTKRERFRYTVGG